MEGVLIRLCVMARGVGQEWSGVEFQVGQGSSLIILIPIYRPHRHWNHPIF